MVQDFLFFFLVFLFFRSLRYAPPVRESEKKNEKKKDKKKHE